MKVLSFLITVIIAVVRFFAKLLLFVSFGVVLLLVFIICIIVLALEALIFIGKDYISYENKSMDDTVVAMMHEVFSKKYWKIKRYKVVQK